MRVDERERSQDTEFATLRHWIQESLSASRNSGGYGIVSQQSVDGNFYQRTTNYVSQMVQQDEGFDLNTYNGELRELSESNRYLVTGDIRLFERMFAQLNFGSREAKEEALTKADNAKKLYLEAASKEVRLRPLLGLTFHPTPSGQWTVAPFMHPGDLEWMPNGAERIRATFDNARGAKNLRFRLRITSAPARVR